MSRKYKVAHLTDDQKEIVGLRSRLFRLEEELARRQGRIANLEDRISRSGLVNREGVLKHLGIVERSISSASYDIEFLEHHLGKIRSFLGQKEVN